MLLPNLATWFQSGPAVSLTVLSLEATLLSSTAPIAQAVLLSVDRISLHLGAVKSASRPGSITAALFALRDVPLPPRGLRASLGGMQIGVAAARVVRPPEERIEPSDGIQVQL